MTLLPANATPLERALAVVVTELLEAVAIPVRLLRSADHAPEAWLPWLAWERHVDTWLDSWPMALRRDAIRDSFRRHAHAGAVAGDRRILAEAGAAYDYTEHTGAQHHRVTVRVLNSQDLRVSVEDLRRALAAVGRASVHYTVTAQVGFAAPLFLAGGAAARSVAHFDAAAAGSGGGAIAARRA